MIDPLIGITPQAIRMYYRIIAKVVVMIISSLVLVVFCLPQISRKFIGFNHLWHQIWRL